jgi:hypothetical protein
MRIKNTFILFLIFLFSQLLPAQTLFRKNIKGNVTVSSAPIDAVTIVNENSNRTTITDFKGDFIIEVREGDVLLVSAVNIMAKEITIDKKVISDQTISIAMEFVNIELEEVIIKEASKISAESVGVIPYGQKRYTQAERHLQTAGDFKPIMLLGLLGGSMPLDPLINKINGRTKRLKKLVVLEAKTALFGTLDKHFDDSYYTKKLKIPSEYIEGFKFYIVENDTFVSYLKNDDLVMVQFLLIEHATTYLEIIKRENP